MKPAPTITTWLPGLISSITARASSSVQNEWTPRPSAPGTGARTGEEPVAIRQSSYSTFAPSSSVHTLAFVSRAAARRPSSAFTFHSVSWMPVTVNTCDSATERSR